MRIVSDERCRENQNKKSYPLLDDVEKHNKVRLARNENMAHALCVLDEGGIAYLFVLSLRRAF